MLKGVLARAQHVLDAGEASGSNLGQLLKLPSDAIFAADPVRRDGIEPPTRGFSVPCSTD